MQIDPSQPRYQLTQTLEGLQIEIPARRQWLLIIFLSVWMCGWAVGEVTVIRQLTLGDGGEDDWFLMIWLAGWTVGGAWACLSILWPLFGKELITLGSGGIDYRVQLLGFGRNRSYASTHISGLRPVDFSSSWFGNQAMMQPPFFSPPIGPIAFDYGADTIRIARSLTEAEARILMATLRQRLPAALF